MSVVVITGASAGVGRATARAIVWAAEHTPREIGWFYNSARDSCEQVWFAADRLVSEQSGYQITANVSAG